MGHTTATGERRAVAVATAHMERLAFRAAILQEYSCRADDATVNAVANMRSHVPENTASHTAVGHDAAVGHTDRSWGECVLWESQCSDLGDQHYTASKTTASASERDAKGKAERNRCARASSSSARGNSRRTSSAPHTTSYASSDASGWESGA